MYHVIRDTGGDIKRYATLDRIYFFPIRYIFGQHIVKIYLDIKVFVLSVWMSRLILNFNYLNDRLHAWPFYSQWNYRTNRRPSHIEKYEVESRLLKSYISKWVEIGCQYAFCDWSRKWSLNKNILILNYI